MYLRRDQYVMVGAHDGHMMNGIHVSEAHNAWRGTRHHMMDCKGKIIPDLVTDR